MNDVIYLRARLDDVRFAVPASSIVKIVSGPTAIAVPAAPEGICGIVRDGGSVFAIISLSSGRRSPAQLAILCRDGTDCRAYAADRVETMDELTEGEQAGAQSIGTGGVLLLERKDRHDRTQ